jgi:LmbE family N-acetylglucosaminyl deacetylase
VATLVTFHAQPDDEAIATGGTMAKAAAEGHRVVLVTATAGECGEVAPGLLHEGETLAERRLLELKKAAAILGVARVEPLGYRDSGMMGTPDNEVPGSFWMTDVEEAARRVADILAEERAEVITIYDSTGSYGHPDHIQVHRVGVRAAELAGSPKVSRIRHRGFSIEQYRLRGAPPGLQEDDLFSSGRRFDRGSHERRARRRPGRRPPTVGSRARATTWRSGVDCESLSLGTGGEGRRG